MSARAVGAFGDDAVKGGSDDGALVLLGQKAQRRVNLRQLGLLLPL